MAIDGQLKCGKGCDRAGVLVALFVLGVLELFADRLGQERAGGEAGGRAERGRRV